ncbi:MAG: DUF3343 domain-containing protein [Spirochaetaceae bacterium]|jgi:hypothetical protein|nr:DUF3343 domain-containing protein [Spirochaetaceae bacterium]
MNMLLSFHEMRDSLNGEQILKKAGFPCILDTAPRSLGPCCVYVIRTESDEAGPLADMLESAGIDFFKIFRCSEVGDTEEYILIGGRYE